MARSRIMPLTLLLLLTGSPGVFAQTIHHYTITEDSAAPPKQRRLLNQWPEGK